MGEHTKENYSFAHAQKGSTSEEPVRILHIIVNEKESVNVSTQNNKCNHGRIVCVSKCMYGNGCNYTQRWGGATY